jgi:prepilin-type processing-associated H-X9-DG protein
MSSPWSRLFPSAPDRRSLASARRRPCFEGEPQGGRKTAGRQRDHRHPGGPAAPRRPAGAEGAVQQQHEATRPGAAPVRGPGEPAPAVVGRLRDWDADASVTSRSDHPEGVNVLLGDGSARFTKSTIAGATSRALGTVSPGARSSVPTATDPKGRAAEAGAPRVAHPSGSEIRQRQEDVRTPRAWSDPRFFVH